MKKYLFVLAIFLFQISLGSYTFASTYSIELGNLPNPSEIESLLIDFSVGNDFTYTQDSLALGVDIPPDTPGSILPWAFIDPNPTVSGGIFTIDMFNSDSGDFIPFPGFTDGFYSENNLINGVIATFEYTGTISFDSYLAYQGNGLDLISYGLTPELITDGVRLSAAVPIPGAIWLLGSGLMGFIGIRRKLGKY